MNQYKKYKDQSVYSMSSAELLLLLYDEILKRLKKADYALEDEDYAIFDDCINRCMRIVRYLITILDRNQPISRNLRRIYDYLIFDLSKIRAGRSAQKEEISRVIHIISELRDAFEEASHKVGEIHMVQGRSVLG